MIEKLTERHEGGVVQGFAKAATTDVDKNPKIVVPVKLGSLQNDVLFLHLFKLLPLCFECLFVVVNSVSYSFIFDHVDFFVRPSKTNVNIFGHVLNHIIK